MWRRPDGANFNSQIRAQRENKVRAMVREGLAVKTQVVAYPGDVVCDTRGNFLGFLMRLVKGYRPIHELYSPKSRLRHFPKANYRFIVGVAQNVAYVIDRVHQAGCVIGDLNHSGVLVAPDGKVALIDADSFQIRADGKMYPCLVGVPDFTAPELHGVNLGAVERTIEHDNFGLAVAIFHLLFMGRHPYAGRYDGPDISMSQAIAENRFAFSLARRSRTRTNPPPGSPTLDLFPAEIVDAFESAFGLDPIARPSASAWKAALTNLQRSLSRCSQVKTHYYPSTGKGCVWCALANKNGFEMFPDLSAIAPDVAGDVRGTEQAIREILAFRLPTAADLLPTVATPIRGPSSALQEARNAKQGAALLGLLLIAGSGLGLFYAAPAWIIWLALAGWGVAMVSNREVNAQPFRQAFQEADKRVQSELDAFVRRNGLVEVLRVRGDLDATIATYSNIDDDLARELSKLNSTREARQRAAYLDRFSIRDANIADIGPARKATLVSFGIETAADVTGSAVRQVPGFGKVLTRKLIDWRRKHEAAFQYQPTRNAQDIADDNALRTKFAGQKARLESTIRNGLNTIRIAKSRLDALPAKARSDRALLKAVADRARAEEDLKQMGATTPSTSVALSITLPSKPRANTQSVRRGMNQPTQQVANPPSTATRRATRSTGARSTQNCPRCGSSMVPKSGPYGRFWGCSRYPTCRGTRKR